MSAHHSPVFRYILYVDPVLHDESQKKSQPWHLEPQISRFLDMLPEDEQASTLKFFRTPDKARALGSRLLKHLAIVRACNIAWNASKVSAQPVNGKPCYQPPSPKGPTVEFNVSHDDNVVILAGVRGNEYQVGIDVMNVKKARDRVAWRDHGGWEGWINTFEAAFHPNEMKAMRDFHPSGTNDHAIRIQKLRLFYCYWVLKEAYIKMTGEAFRDPHIKQLEFRGVRAPKSAYEAPQPGNPIPWGEIVKNFEVWKHGRQLQNVYMELQALGPDYVVATAISKSDDGADEQPFPPVEVIDLQRDVVERYSKWAS